MEGAGGPGGYGSGQDRARLVGAVLEQFGGIDLLVNNAGMAPRQRVDLLEMSEASYDEVLLTNLILFLPTSMKICTAGRRKKVPTPLRVPVYERR